MLYVLGTAVEATTEASEELFITQERRVVYSDPNGHAILPWIRAPHQGASAGVDKDALKRAKAEALD